MQLQENQTIETETEIFDIFKKHSKIKYFVSNRVGGISNEKFAGLNIGLHVNDSVENVIENRIILAEMVQMPLEQFVFCNQIQENTVTEITKHDAGRGIYDSSEAIKDTDALVTNTKNLMLTVQSADCTLLLLYDPENNAIAAVHAGWRGTLKRIAAKTVKHMQIVYKTNPSNLLVAISPSISVENYEIGTEVINAVKKYRGRKRNFLQFNEKTGKFHFDQWTSNKTQLIEAGVTPENIEVSGICTFANSDKYYSSRKDKGITGRFAAGIALID